jgi:hypothetical protein
MSTFVLPAHLTGKGALLGEGGMGQGTLILCVYLCMYLQSWRLNSESSALPLELHSQS